MKVLVVGGNGGIGAGLVNAILESNDDAIVHATYRQALPSFTHDRLNWHQLDVTHEESFKKLASEVKEVDWIINCVGMLHTKEKGHMHHEEINTRLKQKQKAIKFSK